jgi:lactate dehydrogenase-like 2-hydroxyacid dehydrogenase
MKPVVLSLGAFPAATVSTLAERFEDHHYTVYPLPDGTLGPELEGHIRGIATEANRGATRALIESLPKLEIISVFGVGVDAIDLAAARERNIPVTNTPGILADECADLAIGMMLASARQIVFAERFVRSGAWLKGPLPLGRSVGLKTLGIVGLGGIGKAIADRAGAFRMNVIWHGPRPKPDVPYEYVPDILELARRSDYLMVACKGGPATRGLISAAVIDALGPEGTLINIARGSVVDEGALIERLRDGRLGFAALDVYENSPRIAPEFFTLPNVLLQPHQGSATVETRTAMGQLMIDNLTAHFAGRPLLTPVT